MKIFLIAAIACVSVSMINCSSQKKALTSDCYKGRLEIKGICSNYTIKLLEGKIDTAKIAAAWIDETTGKAYTNVFALSSPCTFPATINAGDEFYFTIDTSAPQNCAVCMAFYPTPPKKLAVKIIGGCK